MGIDNRDWYRRKKRLEAGLDPDGGYLKGPEEQPDTLPFRKKPGDELRNRVNRKRRTRRQRRKAVKAMNQTRNPRTGRSVRQWNVAAWVWGVFCVFTWVMYALEHRGILTFGDLLNTITWAWDLVIERASNFYDSGYEWVKESLR